MTSTITLLIQRTQVNVSLTSTLVSLAVFSDDDVDKLDGISTDNAKAQKFYKMIKTKDNFYPHLITALEAGNQTELWQLKAISGFCSL
ncbi:hypothetical protein Ocin01_10548 [Orchesella cincta]|uniref:Uncharacterized protein n=1 Tax=Orchesella cincta TaxID=48709 RepID=A0A1D2MTA1_ORCCI|nr:hypothetical protein Ocin01_10548 [Orchesella cincta]